MFVSDAHIERQHRKWEKQKIAKNNHINKTMYNICIQNISLFLKSVLVLVKCWTVEMLNDVLSFSPPFR